jgi:exopolysaccharide biosynthesis polyprenyl glycosylphosphotransferase
MAVPVTDDIPSHAPAGRSRRLPVLRRRRWKSRRWATTLATAPMGIDAASMTLLASGTGWSLPESAVAGALVVLFNAAGGLYRPRLMPSSLDGGLWMAGSALLVTLLVSGPLLDVGDGRWPQAAAMSLLCTVLALCGRSVLHSAIRRERRRGGGAPALVVGAAEHGQRLAATLLAYPEYGLRPVGFADDERRDGPDLPILGRTQDLCELLRAYGVVALIVTSHGENLQALARAARAVALEVYLAPEAGEAVADFVSSPEHIRGFPVFRMRPIPQSKPTWPLKRAFDIAISLVGLVLSAPVLVVCALAVRLEGGPGVIFRQRRVGCEGDVEVLKLRTFLPADAREAATRWSVEHDVRLSRFGRLLRRSCLDELPQLWNVLRGDMSIVGPRPERPYFVERFSRFDPHYCRRHRVPVGMTGWAQIHGLRGDTSIEDRARFDNHYIDNWSLEGDFKIIVRTVWCLIRPGGA